jgi:hypothetical protein
VPPFSPNLLTLCGFYFLRQREKENKGVNQKETNNIPAYVVPFGKKRSEAFLADRKERIGLFS